MDIVSNKYKENIVGCFPFILPNIFINGLVAMILKPILQVLKMGQKLLTFTLIVL